MPSHADATSDERHEDITPRRRRLFSPTRAEAEAMSAAATIDAVIMMRHLRAAYAIFIERGRAPLPPRRHAERERRA